MQVLLSNGWIGGGVTLLAALGICRVGYSAVWPLFGCAIQALSALALLICAIWLRRNGRAGGWVWAPMIFMLLVSLTALISAVAEGVMSIAGGSAHLLADVLRIVLGLAVFAVTVLLSYQGFRSLLQPDEASPAQ